MSLVYFFHGFSRFQAKKFDLFRSLVTSFRPSVLSVSWFFFFFFLSFTSIALYK